MSDLGISNYLFIVCKIHRTIKKKKSNPGWIYA